MFRDHVIPTRCVTKINICNHLLSLMFICIKTITRHCNRFYQWPHIVTDYLCSIFVVFDEIMLKTV